MPRAILFDLDCTLTDRPATIRRMAERLADELHPIPLRELAAIIQAADQAGYRRKEAFFADLLQRLPWRDAPSLEQLRTLWQSQFPRCTQGACDLGGVLNQLRGMGLAIGLVSNGGSAMQRGKLRRLGIEAYLSAVVISGEVNFRKPDPRIFKLALDRLGISPADAWFVGDHPELDIAGARAAGMQAVWLAGTHPWPSHLPAPPLQIARLSQLVDSVRQNLT